MNLWNGCCIWIFLFFGATLVSVVCTIMRMYYHLNLVKQFEILVCVMNLWDSCYIFIFLIFEQHLYQLYMLLSKFRSLISYRCLYDRLMALYLYFDFQLCLNHLFQLNVCNAYIYFHLVNVNSHSVVSQFFSFLLLL